MTKLNLRHAVLCIILFGLIAIIQELKVSQQNSLILQSPQLGSHYLRYNDSMTTKYYYYEDTHYGGALTYFEQCPIKSWGKNSMEHYFIKQLKENKNGNRIFDCDKANIFVIPVSFGNAQRSRKPLSEVIATIDQLKYEIFDNPQSCWNINHESHNSHLMIVGGFMGRRLMNYTVFQWNHILKNRFIFANSYARINPSKPCVISTGYTSIISQPNIDPTSLNFKITKIVHNMTSFTSKSGFSSNGDFLPQVHVNNKENWKNRKYNLFFMGQADGRKSYRIRRIVLDKLDNKHNILIQTGLKKQWLHKECKRSRNNSVLESIPCAMGNDAMLYMELLSQSKFNLVPRGDEPCTSRFYDAIAMDVINIIITTHDFEFKYCLIGYNSIGYDEWKKMFLWIDETEFVRNPQQSIDDTIAKYNDYHFENMFNVINKWKKYVLWDAINSETAELLLDDAITKCL